MKPRSRAPGQDDLLRPRPVDVFDPRRDLVTLAALIGWEFFEREWAGFLPAHQGRAPRPRRVDVSAARLQAAGHGWCRPAWGENPCYQALHRRDVLSAPPAD